LGKKSHPKQQTVNRRERQPSREAERLQELQDSKSKFHSLIWLQKKSMSPKPKLRGAGETRDSTHTMLSGYEHINP